MDINYAQETNVHQVLVPCIVFFIVSPFLVGTRLWSRMRKGGRLGPADYTVLAALVSLPPLPPAVAPLIVPRCSRCRQAES